MRFVHPEILNWLWGALALGGLLFFIEKRRLKILTKFAASDLLPQLCQNFSKRRSLAKKILWLLVFVFAVLALARPQWGFEMREVKRKGVDILIALDTSKSMLAGDVQPNRLARAKLALRDFLPTLHGDRIGLIAFAGDAFLVCPLTVDYGGFLLSLDEVDTNTIPRGGTDIARAIREAIKEYDTTLAQYRAVIVITDGENLDEDPAAVIEQAKKQGVKIYTIGIGTEAGELIRVKDDTGQEVYVKDEKGNVVKSRLNEKLLQEIALKTGGVYVRASGAEFGLDLIYKQGIAGLEKRDIDTKMERQYYERFQYPLAIALILFIIETCLPLWREKRLRNYDKV
jgi:Ca-activated chloride channel homolog